MFEALLFTAAVKVEEYETKGPGSTRSKQLEQAVRKAQAVVLREYDNTYVMLSEFVFDKVSPSLKLSVVVPAVVKPRYREAYRHYVRTLELFSVIIQEQLHHPSEKITISIEDEPPF